MNSKIERIINNFKARNIEALYFNSFVEVKREILKRISTSSLIGIGNSKTLKKMNISKELYERDNKVFDKTLARSKSESKLLKKKSLLTDWYLTGTNAISMEGHIVNIDHSGNRVAAMLYGPERVIVVVGKNKITESLEEAIYRAKNVAAPLNAKRAGYNPPCVELDNCIDCISEERVCNSLVVIEGQSNNNRLSVFIADEKSGF